MKQQDLLRIMNYDPATGVFTWRVSRGRVKVGDAAGCRNRHGYIVIGVAGKLYYAHQLAWLYQTGEWLERIDHRDNDHGNNRWINLRPATAQQNALNSKRATSNTSGFKGVSWHKSAAKWSAYIVLNGKKRHLGLHETAEAAHDAYMAAATTAQPDFARAA
jgi:hypothetical protein